MNYTRQERDEKFSDDTGSWPIAEWSCFVQELMDDLDELETRLTIWREDGGARIERTEQQLADAEKVIEEVKLWKELGGEFPIRVELALAELEKS